MQFIDCDLPTVFLLQSYLLGSGLLASMLEVLMIYGCKRFHLDLGNFPSGP